jgi:hypothetical protein
MNKIDLLSAEDRAVIGRGGGDPPVVALSAADAGTTAPLLAAVEAALWRRGLIERPPAAEAPAP